MSSPVLLTVAAAAIGLPASSGSAAPFPTNTPGFQVGAADADITPPALGTALGQKLDSAEFVPRCGSSEAQLAQLWPGKRLFAFEKPYVDLFGSGRYVPGDPYCDADATHRYEAPYIAGGSGENHWPLSSADTTPGMNTSATTPASPNLTDDPIGTHAVVFAEGGRRVAMVTVDSIGLFDTTMDQIRAAVHRQDAAVVPQDVFVSSTHDESAPDPIGLWGPDLSGEPPPLNQAGAALPTGVSSGVDEYYMQFLVDEVATAVVRADSAVQPANLRLTVTRMPANAQSCWSSYPFVDTNLVPAMQGVATSPGDAGRVIFTMVNVGTHDESLAFSGNPTYTSMLSGDWTGRLSARLESAYGGVGMEMAGPVGSVETPALYPEGTQVLQVPGAHHDVPANPVDGCSSVYPEPLVTAAGAPTPAPETDALKFVDEYAKSVADASAAALGGSATTTTVAPSRVSGQASSVCVQLENNFFAAAFGAGLFPDRPAYADPSCTVGVSASATVENGSRSQPAPPRPTAPAFIRSSVGVLTLGTVQIAYSPGEVFPFTEVGGPVDAAQMPFPTDCYQPSPSNPTNPMAGNYGCGSPLPTTPLVSAEMTTPYRFLAGLGQDMIGYLFPPGNFVGSQGETFEAPWSVYESTAGGDHDRFGYGHADDSESVGPYAGLAVTEALAALLSRDGKAGQVVPGMFVDTAGHLCDSPFPTPAPEDTGKSVGSWVTGCAPFTGAVGVRVAAPGGTTRTIDVGTGPGDASAWATYLATPDSGTSGTAYPYSTATRGVIVGGQPMLIDVIAGARDLGLPQQ